MKEERIARLLQAGGWGLLIGGLAGFALGMLIAPEKGQKIRRRLSYRIEHLGDKVSQFVDHVGTHTNPGETRKKGEALVADAEAKARNISKDMDNLMRQHRSAQTP